MQCRKPTADRLPYRISSAAVAYYTVTKRQMTMRITGSVLIFLIVTVCYSTASSIARNNRMGVSDGVEQTVALAADNVDITAESQNYRPYYNNRPSMYNTGYSTRRPAATYPTNINANNKRPITSNPNSYNNNRQPTHQQQATPVSNKPTNTNSINISSTNRPVSSANPVAIAASNSNSNARGACGVTNGVYEQWGVCWNYEKQILEVSKSKMTPDSFGQFYKLMAQSSFLSVPTAEWVRSVCQAATLMVNNEVVMCAPEDHCMNERGVSYYENCYNYVCVCLIDDKYAPSKNELIQHMSSMLPAWTIPHAIAGMQLIDKYTVPTQSQVLDHVSALMPAWMKPYAAAALQ